MIENFNSNLETVFERLLILKNVKFTSKGIYESLINVPYANSVKGFCNALNNFKIDNRAIKIDSEDVHKLPLPFVALIQLPNTGLTDFVLVESLNSEEAIYYYRSRERIELSFFKRLIDNEPLIVFDPLSIGIESDYEINKKKEFIRYTTRFSLYIALALLYFLSLYPLILTFPYNAYLLFTNISSLIGLFVALIALSVEIKPNNFLLQKVCSANSSSKANCNAVLNSSYSSFLGLPISLYAAAYFFVFVLLTSLAGFFYTIEKLAIDLYYINFFSIILIPLSLYLQKNVIRQWCKLCLIIVLCLAFNLLIGIYFRVAFNSFDVNLYTMNPILLICFISSIGLFTIAYYLIKKNYKLQQKVLRANNYIYRKDVLEVVLNDCVRISDGWEDIQYISKGNDNYSDLIIKVCNPVCSHCSVIHQKLNELISIKPKLKVVTIYYVPNSLDDSRSLIVSAFLHFAKHEEFEKLYQAMDYWYLNKNRNTEELLSKFNLNKSELDKYSHELEAMYSWCKSGNITYTPTLFWNNRKLPVGFDFDLLFKAI